MLPLLNLPTEVQMHPRCDCLTADSAIRFADQTTFTRDIPPPAIQAALGYT